MIIHIYCSDGSPLGVTSKTIWGDAHQMGIGGAELALLTLCEEWTKVGHEVVLYNNPKEANASPFDQRSQNEFNPNDDRDVIIIFRTPNPRIIGDKGLKVWWSTDQYTSQPFADFAPMVDKIVCISPFHAEYFATTYGITDTTVIDLPVRVDDYKDKNIDKVPNRLIFNSIPDRGLENLWRMWGKLRQEIPDISLVVTSDYRLWGAAAAGNERHKMRWLVHDGVEFIGAVPRARLIAEELKAQINLYVANYEELFCIAVAENQFAGAYPITSAIGALRTTNMGKIFDVDPNDPRNDVHFVEATVELLNAQNVLTTLQWQVQDDAEKRFAPKEILKQWDEKVFT